MVRTLFYVASRADISQASPHIAGLAAYLLSLYPETFVPTAEDWSVEESTPERVQSLYQSGRQFVFGKVNEWTGVSFVAPHKSPKKDKTLSPAVLKSAMIRALRSVCLLSGRKLTPAQASLQRACSRTCLPEPSIS